MDQLTGKSLLAAAASAFLSKLAKLPEPLTGAAGGPAEVELAEVEAFSSCGGDRVKGGSGLSKSKWDGLSG